MSKQHTRGSHAKWSELGAGPKTAVVAMAAIVVVGGTSLLLYMNYQNQQSMALANQQGRIAAEEQARLEQEAQAEAGRLASKEEAAHLEMKRIEQERVAAESEQARLETEARKEAERIAAEETAAAEPARRQTGATSQQPTPSEGSTSSSISSTDSSQPSVECGDTQNPREEPTSGVGKEMADSLGAVWDPEEGGWVYVTGGGTRELIRPNGALRSLDHPITLN